MDVRCQNRKFAIAGGTELAPGERRELLELAESVAALGHWLIDLESGSLYWSDEIYRIHGLTPETYQPDIESAIDFYHPDDAAHVSRLVDSAISERRPFEFKFRLVRPDGTVRTVHSKARIGLDDHGNVASVFGIFQDITDREQTEAALRESQQRFDLAVRGSSAGLWDWNIVTGDLYWSPRFMEIVGVLPEAFRPTFREFDDRLHPQDRDRVMEALSAHLEQRIPYDVEFRLRRESGEYVWVHARGQAQWDSDGRAVRMAGSSDDISKRKREESFREAVYSLLTTDDVEFDVKIAQMLNLGRSFLKLDVGFVTRLAGGEHECEFAVGGEGGPLEALLAGDGESRCEKTLRHNDLLTHCDIDDRQGSESRNCAGNDAYIGVPLRVNGRIYGVLGFCGQMTISRRFRGDETSFVTVLAKFISFEFGRRETLSRILETQRAVERKQVELDRILNTVPARIWYKDETNKILRLNTRAAESMGVTVEDAEGADVYELFPAMADKYHDDDLRIIRSGEAEFGIIEQYTPRDGARGWTSTDKIPFVDQATGEPRLLVVSQDISALMQAQHRLEKQAEELRQTNRDLDHFAYVASHDLRAPMRGIQSLASWIEEDLGDEIIEDVRVNLELMQKRVARMDTMLQDMLTFARAGKNQANAAPVDINVLLAEVVEWVDARDGIAIHVEPVDFSIVAPRTEFQQLFLNLISNAVKHHDCKAGNVWVSGHAHADRIEFIVRDDGPGIPIEYHEKVFEVFKTLNRRDEVEGSGIGLAVVQRIARALGGAVSLRSPVTDRGGEFTITLPVSFLHIEMPSARVS